jgi:type III restriction enzyme
MQLKEYQERVLKEINVFLTHLEKEQTKGGRNPALDAWDTCKATLNLRGDYNRRKNGLGKDLPTVSIKVPTGGGKTFLATKALGEIYRTILKDRNGTGLVLWVVPSDQIFKDTIKALRDKRHYYRESLEFSVNKRIEIWEKHEIGRITPSQLASNLNILVLVMASTNRESKDQLKFFQDSGGNIITHFPPEDEPVKHKNLKSHFSNLDMIVNDESTGEHLVRTSIANLVRIFEPVIILDEGHKATSNLARETLEGFNPRFILELSATPPAQANIISRVSGAELFKEEMIKLPINVVTSNEKSWKECLSQAKDKRNQLEKVAETNYKSTGKLIRPIVLVQVERTGKDQIESQFIHSSTVKEFLIQKLGIAPGSIAIKSAEIDELEPLDKKGVSLMDDGNPIEWIITKGALQEGWDCPFAYILVSLNNSGSKQSLTQLVGRVLRQPYVKRSENEALNQSYIYCLRKSASETIKDVKRGLEEEGYEGSLESVVRDGTEKDSIEKRKSKIRDKYTDMYKKEFKGKIYLPHFSVKENKNSVIPLDYYSHLFSKVNVKDFTFETAKEWKFDFSKNPTEQVFRISLGEQSKIKEIEISINETDEQIEQWLIANISFEAFSQRELEFIVDQILDLILIKSPEASGKLYHIKFDLLERTKGLIQREVDLQTQEAFKVLYEMKKLVFYLECKETRFEIPREVELRKINPLRDVDFNEVQRSLFDYVPDDLNEYERSVALYLDKHPEVLWWFRNLVGKENFAIQGYRKNKIYPDFVVQQNINKKTISKVVVVESKGKHLAGNEDTEYKKSVAEYFDKVGKKVTWQKLAQEFEGDEFRFQVLDEGEYADRSWKTEIKQVLDQNP